MSRLDMSRKLIGRLVVRAHRRRLSYEDAIGWFVANRPEDDADAQGAILRVSLPGDRVEITLMFVDHTGELRCDAKGRPYACRLTVDGLDEELADAFGDTPLLIIN